MNISMLAQSTSEGARTIGTDIEFLRCITSLILGWVFSDIFLKQVSMSAADYQYLVRGNRVDNLHWEAVEICDVEVYQIRENRGGSGE